MKASVHLACALLFFSPAAQGQEQIGLRSGNFAGLNGWALNPSAHTSSPYNWEIGLLEGAFYFDNNYAFLRNTHLAELLRRRDDLNIVHGPDYDKETPPPPGSIMADYYEDGRKRYANGIAALGGPAFFVRLNEQHAIGMFTRARVFASGRGVANAFSYYRYFERPFFETFEVDPFKMSIAAWGELGLNYLFQTPVSNGKLGIGISARYLQGWEGIYLNNRSTFQLAKLPGDTLSGGPIQFEYAHTYSNLQPENRRVTPNGAGAALDIGLTWIIGEENDYDWRLGFSILDIGRLQFNRNARLHRVNTTDVSTIGFNDYDDFIMPQELEPMLELFSTQTLGTAPASEAGARFGVWLPGAISVQADRKLGGGFFLHALVVQGIPMGGAAMWRGGLAALTPRFESRWLELALPLSLHHGNRPQIGLSGRLGPLSLGTDRLGSIFTRSNLDGADFYFALKIQPFRIQANSSDKDPRQSGGLRGLKAARVKAGNGSTKCYKFR